MATPKWQAGKLYLPGALVQPRSEVVYVPATLQNPGFESGSASGWDITTNLSGVLKGQGVTSYRPHSGTYNYSVDLASGTVDFEALNQAQPSCAPGTLINASVYLRLSFHGTTKARCFLAWYDGGGVEIGRSEAAIYQKPGNKSEVWFRSVASGIAPAGTASVRLGFWGEISGDGDLRFDNASWDYSPGAPPEGLIYKAVQPAAGLSDNAEPTWPTTLGVQVIDNEVIWEAVAISRLVWKAIPILKSAGAEPLWPTTVGERVSDGTISWEAVSRHVEDENCPNGKVVTIMASKVFCADKDIVAFSATADPLDWTSTKDAGYLPTGLQQANSNDMAVLAPYRSNLAAFNSNCFQNWQVDPDPEAMAILDQMDGVGSRWQQAARAVGNELFYLAPLGVRTVGIAGASTNLQAGDVGMPVDEIISAAIVDSSTAGTIPVATYYPSSGQYWLAFPEYPEAGETEAFVYTMTETGKIGAWTRYEFPFSVEAFAQLGDDLYIKRGDYISRVTEQANADEVTPSVMQNFPGIVQWAYLDFGAPGVTKMMEGFDYVGLGQGPSISFGYDQRNLAAFTTPYQVDPDTMVGGIIPMPVQAPTFSVKLEFAGGASWRLQSVSLLLDGVRGGP